jgi:hypothetical protein
MNVLGLENYNSHVKWCFKFEINNEHQKVVMDSPCVFVWNMMRGSFIHSTFKNFRQSNSVMWHPSWNKCSSWIQPKYLTRLIITHESNKHKTPATDMLLLCHCKNNQLKYKVAETSPDIVDAQR